MSHEPQESDIAGVESTQGAKRDLSTDIVRIAASGAKKARDLALVAQRQEQ